MYITKFQIFFLLLLTFTILSCGDNTVNNSNPPPAGTEFKYPYKSGSFWYYSTKNFITNIRPDSLRVYFNDDTLTGNGAAEFSTDSIINNDTVKLLKNSHNSAGHDHTTLEYYKQTDSGLIRIAYYTDGANFGPFRPSPYNLKYNLNGRSYHSIKDLVGSYNTDKDLRDSTPLIIDNPPRKTIKYPVVENSEWTLVTYGTTRITKKYTGFETVVVPGGSFYCVKIKRSWYYDSAVPEPNSISYDYFSKEGMIKRDFLIKDILITNSTGAPIGYIDVKEEAYLNIYILP